MADIESISQAKDPDIKVIEQQQQEKEVEDEEENEPELNCLKETMEACSPSLQPQPKPSLSNGTVASPTTTGGAPSGTPVNIPLITRPNILNSSAIQSSSASPTIGSPVIETPSSNPCLSSPNRSLLGSPLSRSSPTLTTSCSPVSKTNPTNVFNSSVTPPQPPQQQPTALPNGTVSSPTTGGAPSGTAVSLPLISRPNIVNSSAIQSSTPTTSTGSHIIRTTAATINMNTTMSSMAPGRQTVLLTQADGSKIPVMIQTSSSGQTSIVGNSQMGNVLVRPGTPGQQVLVSNPNVVPQMVLTTRPGGQPINLQQLQQQQLTLTPGQQQANRALAPRPGYIVQNGPVRFNPQGLRPGTSPAIVSQGLTLRPGMGPILIRTEQGLQLVNVGPATGGATSLPPGIRFQTPGIRPQTGMSINLGSPSVGPLRPGMQTVTMTQQGMQQQQSIGLAPTQPLTIQTSQANTQAASAAPSQMSPNTAKKKCKNFLSTLIKLANDQPEQVATNVRKLIQDLIDGVIPPEDFTDKLQRELKSSPQPCLVPFLKKSLPHLRQSLVMGELSIEGVQAPRVQTGMLTQQVPLQLGARPGIRFLTTPMALAPGQMGQTGVIIQRPGMGPTMMMRPPAPPVQTQLKTFDKFDPKTAKKTKPTKGKVGNQSKPEKLSKSLREDDDINDVAAMGGVNLLEESQRMAAAANEVGTQIRSCKDDTFLFSHGLSNRINRIASSFSLEEVPSDVISLVSHAAQERLKSLIERLGIIAEHRLENMKMNPKYEVTQDVRAQIKFLEELDKLEKKRHEEQEREILLRAAKSRSKLEDPEQLKLKQKAKEMQRAEMEEARQREANETALLAIGSRKKVKLDSMGGFAAPSLSGTTSSFNQTNSNHFSNSIFSTPSSKLPIRRMKRVNLKDLQFLLEQDRKTSKSNFLYRTYAK